MSLYAFSPLAWRIYGATDPGVFSVYDSTPRDENCATIASCVLREEHCCRHARQACTYRRACIRAAGAKTSCCTRHLVLTTLASPWRAELEGYRPTALTSQVQNHPSGWIIPGTRCCTSIHAAYMPCPTPAEDCVCIYSESFRRTL